MTITPVVPPANFNLAVETLKRTLRQDKVSAEVLSQAQVTQVGVGLDYNVSAPGSELNLGRKINTEA
jgi:hypothetical protein